MARQSYPLLIDLNHCVIGSFVGLIDSTDPAFCELVYFPAHQYDNLFKVLFRGIFPAKPIRYPYPIPRDSVISYKVPKILDGDLGQVMEIIVLTEDKDGKCLMLDSINEKKMVKLKEMREKIEAFNTDAKIKGHEIKNLKDAKNKQEAQAKGPRQPNSPFGSPFGNYPYGDRYGGYGNNQFGNEPF